MAALGYEENPEGHFNGCGDVHEYPDLRLFTMEGFCVYIESVGM